MRKLVHLLVVLSLVTVLLALSVGVAFADNTGGGTEWTCAEGAQDPGCPPLDRTLIGPAAQNAIAPVGSHLLGDVPGAPGNENGFDSDNDSQALENIGKNPLCPVHPVAETP